MKKRLRSIFLGGLFILFAASPTAAVLTPQSVFADKACEARVLGVPPWYRGLTTPTTGTCDIKTPNNSGKEGDGQRLGAFIWKIVLNIIEMAMVITAYITVFFIIYGGFQFMTGGSSPGTIEKGKKTVTNAIIGLVVSMAAIAIVNIIFSII